MLIKITNGFVILLLVFFCGCTSSNDGGADSIKQKIKPLVEKKLLLKTYGKPEKYVIKSGSKKDPFRLPYKSGAPVIWKSSTNNNNGNKYDFNSDNLFLTGIVKSKNKAVALLKYKKNDRQIINFILKGGNLIRDDGTVLGHVHGRIVGDKVIINLQNKKIVVSKK